METGRNSRYAASMLSSGESCELQALGAALAEDFLTTDGGRILQLALAEEPEQADLDAVLSGLDIETLRGTDALLLAYVMQRDPSLRFGAENEPRLQGLLRYHRFRSLKQVADFSALPASADPAGPPLAGYEAALRWLLPKTYRPFASFGFATRADYGITDDAAWAALLSRSTVQEVFRVRCRVPAPEDMLLAVLCRILWKLRHDPCYRNLGYDVRDLIELRETLPIDPEVLTAGVRERGLQVQYRLVAGFLRALGEELPPLRETPDAQTIKRYLNAERRYLALRYTKRGRARLPWLRALIHRIRTRKRI